MNILVVKLTSIGDVVMATPVAKALRKAYPDAHIAWVVEDRCIEVIDGNPYLDEVIVWKRMAKTSSGIAKTARFFSSLFELRAALHKRFDIVIDLQGLFRSAAVVAMSGASVRIGFSTAREGAALTYNRRLPSEELVAGPQNYLKLLTLLGIESDDLDGHMPIGETDREFAGKRIAEALRENPGLTGVVAMCPATTWPQKHWTEDGWAELADRLVREHKLLPFFLGAKADIPLLERIRGKMSEVSADAVGKATLKQSSAIVEQAELVFAVDTGLLHIGMALDKPSIGIFGPTKWRHFLQKSNFIPVAKYCPHTPCMRRPKCEQFDCMRDLTARDVLAAAGRWPGGKDEAPSRSLQQEAHRSERIRSLHVETGMHALGGPAQVEYLVAGLKKLGHEACLVCPEGSSISKHAEAAGLDVITVPLHTDLDARFIFRLCRIIRDFKPDVVHLHSRRGADIMGGIAARTCRVPAVVLSRRIDDPVKKGLLSKLKYGPLCDRIIAISNGIVEALRKGGIREDKIICVRSVVDAKRYQSDATPADVREELGINNGAKVIAVIAQLIERKGHRFLFQAAPRILEAHPDTVFLVLGEGKLEDDLKRQAGALGIGDRVIFAGFRDDISRVLKAIDLLVHPATMEGLGIAILQAMAACVPVVATHVGGIPESVRDGITGLLIPPKNPDAVADAVIRLLGDPGMRRRMGDAGRGIVESEFSVDTMVEGVLSVYRQVLGRQE
ncbi:MAG: glycosyltransferase [Armatimonadota bacterium]